jgi:hypothetical protein
MRAFVTSSSVDSFSAAQHNLPSEEMFVPVAAVEESTGRTLRCEHFARYGEDGHELTYFRV